MKGVGNMERKLLGSIDNEKASVKVYTGPMTDTEEKRRELLGNAMISFAKAIQRSDPNKLSQICKPIGRNE